MIEIVHKIKKNIEELKTRDKDLESEINREKEQIESKNDILKKKRKEMIKLKISTQTLLAESADTYRDVSSIQLKHLIWGIIGFVFLTTATIHIKK